MTPVGSVTAGIGEAGRLIPPTDHHVIANALRDRPSVTLHIYGGELGGVPGLRRRSRRAVRSRVEGARLPRLTPWTIIDLRFQGRDRVIATAVLRGPQG